MKQLLEGTETEVTLAEDHIYFGGMHLDYRLSVRDANAGREFIIFVGKGSEHQEAGAGRELERALECYRRVVRGGVTPCTLCDVLEDLRYA